jgi:hypothetical protein
MKEIVNIFGLIVLILMIAAPNLYGAVKVVSEEKPLVGTLIAVSASLCMSAMAILLIILYLK